MIEKLKNQNLTNLHNIEMRKKELTEFSIELENDNLKSSEYLRYFQNNLKNITAHMSNLENLLATYDIMLSKYALVFELNNQIEELKKNIDPDNVLKIQDLQAQKQIILNQIKMLTYE